MLVCCHLLTQLCKPMFLDVCSYTYTAQDVKQMLAEKKARGTARMNIATEKAKLIRIRDHAQETGDVNEVEKYVAVLGGISRIQARNQI